MKLVSWNVNGLRACVGKGFLDFVELMDADVICLQETKLQPHQIELDLPQYHIYWNSADKRGYSGTAVFTKREPLIVTCDFGEDIHRHEGRVITCEYPDFYLVCCYTPNSQDELRRLAYRMDWEDALRGYLCELDAIKPVVYCGGGATARSRARGTWGGGSTISSCPSGCADASKTRIFWQRSRAATTAPCCWSWRREHEANE